MLKQRVITALILAPILIALTLYVPSAVFAVVAALVFTLAAWEWAGLSALTGTTRYAYAAGLLLGLGLLNRMLPTEQGLYIGLVIISVGIVWWAAASLFVMAFPSGHSFFSARAVRALSGLLVLLPAHVGLVLLHLFNPMLALLVMVLVSFADIGAYFAGRAFGRHKLAPRVSPGKTWEGLAGGLLAVLAMGVFAARVLAIPETLKIGLPGFLALCVITAVASVLGDLNESMFKRMVGAKDSGHLLPGHGGVLDRVDSITAAAPVFAFGLLWLRVTA